MGRLMMDYRDSIMFAECPRGYLRDCMEEKCSHPVETHTRRTFHNNKVRMVSCGNAADGPMRGRKMAIKAAGLWDASKILQYLRHGDL